MDTKKVKYLRERQCKGEGRNGTREGEGEEW